MPVTHTHALLVVLFVAALAPLFTEVTIRLRLPLVVVELLLGAFAAGSLVGLLARGPGTAIFRHKLDALGFGFLIPIFFVNRRAGILRFYPPIR